MTRVTLSLRQLGAEPHTNEVGTTTIIAFDQHAATTLAAVVLPGDDSARRQAAARIHIPTNQEEAARNLLERAWTDHA